MSTVADSLEMDKIYENKYDLDIEESDDRINDLDPSISLIQSPPQSQASSSSSPSPTKGYSSDSITNTPIVEVDTSALDWESTRYRSNTLDLSGEQAIINIYKRRITITNEETLSKSVINLKAEALQAELWEYPGWGKVTEMSVDSSNLPKPEHKHQLDIYRSTSIAGNDLLASVLYTTGLVAAACGQLAPIAVLLCVLALYPFKKIFQECGTALPLNGGVYVALLNSASKFTATFAASCSLISYSATAVVSAASCTAYAAGTIGSFNQIGVTIAIMAFFALLVTLGVKDSANVATAIFAFHLVTLIILMLACLIEIGNNGGSVMRNNWQYPLPISKSGGIGMDLYLGYSVALLGLTGFETSANYIEEAGPFETQKFKGGIIEPRKISVFERTISNMYWLVLLINPAITILTLGVVDLNVIINNPNNILSIVGYQAGGIWLQWFVTIDALIVLTGGVLTANVGIIGLIRQLASDRCLPFFLTTKNKTFQTNHWISFFFFLLCTTLYLITSGDVTILSGVFSIAFLMVLIMFAIANMRLKFNRPKLPRGVKISWIGAIIGCLCMVIGVIGNIINNNSLILYFLIYLAFYFSVILITFKRVTILKFILYICQQFHSIYKGNIGYNIRTTLQSMKDFSVVFFTSTDELHVLNKAILYARDNDNCDKIIITHIYNKNDMILHNNKSKHIITKLKMNLQVLDYIYPKMKVDLLLIDTDEEFSPQLVKYISNELKIPPSFMYMRCPGPYFPYSIAEFDNVRIIMQ